MTNKLLTDITSAAIGMFLIIIGVQVGTAILQPIAAIVSSIVLVVISILFHQMGKQTTLLYGVSFIINSIATGISVSAFYVYTEDLLSTDIILQVVGLALCILVFMAILYAAIRDKSARISFFILFLIGSIVITLILFIRDSEPFYSFLFFIFIFVDFHVWGFFKETLLEDDYYKQKSTISFGVYVLITIVVLIILSEGDILSGGGIGPLDPDKKQKQEL